MRVLFRSTFVIITVTVGSMVLPGGVFSGTMTGPCVDCHTMHNSQDNQTVTIGGGMNDLLLVADCVTCHTGLNAGNTGGRMPSPGGRSILNDPPFIDDDVNAVIYMATGTEAGANSIIVSNQYPVYCSITLPRIKS